MLAADYIRVSQADPHIARGRELLAAHPDPCAHAGRLPVSAVCVVITPFRRIVR